MTTPIALPQTLRAEIAAHPERFRPEHTGLGAPILALNGDFAGRIGTSTGLAGWTHDRNSPGGFSSIFIEDNGGNEYLFGIDERGPQAACSAWSLVCPGMYSTLFGRQPTVKPKLGHRVLVLDGEVVQGQVGVIVGGMTNEPLVSAPGHSDAYRCTRWATLPAALAETAVEANR